MSLYHEAVDFLKNEGKAGSLRTIVYSAYDKNNKNSKSRKCDPRQVYALVSETLKYRNLLTSVIKASGMLKQERKLTMELAQLMVHDLLLSKSGRINAGKSPLKESVLRHKTRLKAELVKYKVKHKIKDTKEVLGEEDYTPVRWVRINTLLAPKDDDGNYNVIKILGNKPRRVVDTIQQLEPGYSTLFKDPYIENLYGIHPSDKITNLSSYTKGEFIIQDRASCFPAAIVKPKPGDFVIDACSAPGNKTTHLAAYVGGTPNSIIAFERDISRAKTLKKMVGIAGASECVEVRVQDFTETDPQDPEFSRVSALVVDPSCSGSGIFGRAFSDNEGNAEIQESDDAEGLGDQKQEFRLHSLAQFQARIVKHAMQFPNAKTVCYSTCSIHAEENERVVKTLLSDADIMGKWQLRSRDKVLPSWTRRGWEGEFEGDSHGESKAQSLVRANPREDGGIGFFAACFERIEADRDQDQPPARKRKRRN